MMNWYDSVEKEYILTMYILHQEPVIRVGWIEISCFFTSCTDFIVPMSDKIGN